MVIMTIMKRWPVHEAKAGFSELLSEAQRSGPQAITKHAKRIAVVLSEQDYERLTMRGKVSLLDYFAKSPLAGAEDLDLRRDKSTGPEAPKL